MKKLLAETKRKSAKNSFFVKTQVNHKSRQPWDPKMIDWAMHIYYTSPAAYKKLKQEGIILPGISTLQSYVNKISILPGFADDVFSRMKIKIQNWTTQQRLCVLTFDEISLKKHLNYSKKYDMIEGFQDLGELGRQNSYATEALVFMISGLCGRWKIPVAYFLSSNSTKGEELKLLITTYINKIKECGFIPKAVVCDQGSNNRSAISKLNIPTENPVLDIDNEKIFFCMTCPILSRALETN